MQRVCTFIKFYNFFFFIYQWTLLLLINIYLHAAIIFRQHTKASLPAIIFIGFHNCGHWELEAGPKYVVPLFWFRQHMMKVKKKTTTEKAGNRYHIRALLEVSNCTIFWSRKLDTRVEKSAKHKIYSNDKDK